MAIQEWCRVCGAKYTVCPTCAEIKTYRPWRTICDTQDHYKVWLIVEQYKKGILEKQSALSQLSALDLKDTEMELFIPSVYNTIQEIMEPAKVEQTINRARKGRSE